MKMISDLSQQELKELLSYNPLTGFFTWRERQIRPDTQRTDKTWNTRYAGTQAGSPHKDGYVKIYVNNRAYLAHRLAYLYMTGEWPENEIDHEDGDRSDNRWHKIHPVTKSGQMRNRGLSTNNTSGVMGVYFNIRCSKWVARIAINGKTIFLGQFTDKEEAVAAREAANEKYRYHSNHGKRKGHRG